MAVTAGNRVLCGPASHAAQKLLQEPQTTAVTMGAVISQLFAFSAATEYLWRLADTVRAGVATVHFLNDAQIANQTPSIECPVLHRTQVRNAILARARALEKTAAAPVGRSKANPRWGTALA